MNALAPESAVRPMGSLDSTVGPAEHGSANLPSVTPAMNPWIEIRDVHFSRGHRKIFDGLNISIPQGQVTAIMGPSGTGKTTLLRLIGGQLRPDRGEVLVEGRNVHRLKRRELYRQRRRMGMLFQSGALLTDLNVFDNVAFPVRENTRLPENIIRTLVLMKLEAVGLRGARDLWPSELSGGMARRVALARAIALDPLLMMYDEPFTGLDPITMGVIVTLIRRLNDALGMTSIIVSHDVAEASSIADVIYLISDGRVVDHGPPQRLRDGASAWSKQFLEGLPDGPVPFHYPAPDYRADLMQDGRR